ncbi:MAG: 30S ribosomal protein S6 [Firmicutes bacterium]|nr:30S ribosomal protein S6 [Bacillota bacterium]
MNKYEMLYIVSSAADEQAREAVIAKISGVVTKAGGTIDNVDKIGLKKFAYPINDRNDGFYVLMNFNASSTVPAEIERVAHLTNHFVRHMFVRK